ncbi:tetratricopeptide repeat-containing sulfotransferase family protein [Neptunicella sp. SCSIO 80796]|uniref:tetratricopeptide repeat-containing sulfotransferase family protein n=1 Tax=Neptunicella plasticusilytica TaxID=3117012 RepID=UPI003A4DD9F8
MPLTATDHQQQIEQAKQYLDNRQLVQADAILQQLVHTHADDIEIHLLQSQIFELRGWHQQQLDCLMKVVDFSSQHPQILVRIAFAQLALSQFAQAQNSAVSVLHNPAASSADWRNCGKLFHAIGLYKLSAQAYSKAVQQGENSESIYYDLGMAHTLSGQIPQAVDAYHKSIQTYPDYAMAYAGLSKARKATEQTNHTRQLEKLLENTRNPWAAINLYHSLAKEWDDLGQYQQSLNTLETGKHKLRRVCPHTAAFCVDNAAAIKNVYQKYINSIPQQAESDSAQQQSPIFVTGMPRSGTTVVERILTNHSEVVGCGERLQFSLAAKSQGKKSYTALFDAQSLDEQWQHSDFAQIGRQYLQSTAYLHNGARYFVDKLPLNIFWAGAILKALPQAKIVCLLRDPLDTLIGNYRQVFEYGSGTYTYTLDLVSCARYIKIFRELALWLAAHFPQRVTLVSYEELVSQPQTQAKALLEFCGLEWQAHCVDIHKNQAAVGSASAAQVKEPIHHRSKGHAKNYLAWMSEMEHFFD